MERPRLRKRDADRCRRSSRLPHHPSRLLHQHLDIPAVGTRPTHRRYDRVRSAATLRRRSGRDAFQSRHGQLPHRRNHQRHDGARLEYDVGHTAHRVGLIPTREAEPTGERCSHTAMHLYVYVRCAHPCALRWHSDQVLRRQDYGQVLHLQRDHRRNGTRARRPVLEPRRHLSLQHTKQSAHTTRAVYRSRHRIGR